MEFKKDSIVIVLLKLIRYFETLHSGVVPQRVATSAVSRRLTSEFVMDVADSTIEIASMLVKGAVAVESFSVRAFLLGGSFIFGA